MNLERRFAALDDRPDLEQLLNFQPGTAGAAAAMYGQALFGLFFAGISGFGVLLFGAIAGPLAIVPMLFVVFGVIMAVAGFKRAVTYQSAPLERFRAAIIDERVKLSGGGKNTSASTHYFATLQIPDGERTEFRVNDDIASKVAPGDMGIAFVKGQVLLDFLVVPV